MVTINNIAELEQIQGGKGGGPCDLSEPATRAGWTAWLIITPLVTAIGYAATCG